MSATAFKALRRLTRPRVKTEQCAFCAVELPVEHRHVVEPARQQMLCSCRACALLFGVRPQARYRLVPEDARRLPEFHMTDAQWEGLHLPIRLAFFYYSSTANRVIAVYPSPAGPTESLLPLEAWEDLANANPFLRQMEADVEALLVHRVRPANEYYRVGIDECYRLVGLLRTNWHGLSGGAQVWEKIDEFFCRLRVRSPIGAEGSRCPN